MSREGPRQRVVIAGGGTAGWMTAAALSRLIAHAGVDITLIESDEIGTVGVGEATIPTLMDFNAMLGINEDEFLRATLGTMKLGIEFVDWGFNGSRYIHPFGVAGRDQMGIKFHQFWLKLSQQSRPERDVAPFETYNLSAVAARQNKFLRPSGGPNAVLSSLRYAFHFDAGLYARFLRKYAEDRGVLRVESKIVDVSLQPENGYIGGVFLEDGRQVEGDLFIDCSGFRGLLISGGLQVGYHDWRSYLPCNRALAVPCENSGPPLPYTRSTADVAGWRWRIPLQHRIGNGYVYASDFISDNEAEGRLLASLDGEPLADPRPIRFVTGRRDAFWKKNCVAIGLAAGFLEPLESTSIHLIQTGIAKLLALWPGHNLAAAEIDEYNRLTILEYEQVRDFIILHYKATQRDDTAFWRYCRDMDIPDTLRHKIDLFREHGRVFRREDDLFTVDSWLAVLLGQAIVPKSYDPLVDSLPLDEVEAFVHHVHDMVAKTATAMPTHQSFIDAHFRAAAPPSVSLSR